VGKDVQHELANVVKDPPSSIDRRHNRGEVVVRQDHGRGVARHIGSGAPHGNTDVGMPECGCIVDAVAGHRHDLTSGAQRFADSHLALGRRPCENDLLVDRKDGVQLGIAHAVELVTGDDVRLALSNPYLPGDLSGSKPIVPRDHVDSDACQVRLRDGGRNAFARRVSQCHQSEKYQPALSILSTYRHTLSGLKNAVGNGQHPKASSCVLIHRCSKFRARFVIDGPRGLVGVKEAVAERKDALECSLGMDTDVAGAGATAGFLVDGRHEQQMPVEVKHRPPSGLAVKGIGGDVHSKA
jgi:hypothetical protein